MRRVPANPRTSLLRDRSSRANPAPSSGSSLSAELDRRRFLRYVGAGAATLAGATQLLPLTGCRRFQDGAGVPPDSWTGADGVPRWTSPPYPVPLPGEAAGNLERFRRYGARDELVLPEGWRYEVLARWGERLGPADDPSRQVTFGYNNDYTGLVPIAGTEADFWLLVNHEYVTLRPFLEAQREDGIPDIAELSLRAVPDQPWHKYGLFSIDGWEMEGNRVSLAPGAPGPPVPPAVRDAMRRLSDQSLETLGVSILRVRRREDGAFQVVADAPDHKRIATQSFQNIAPGEGGTPPFRFSGPAAVLLPPPVGTFSNCSGGTTPWGTFLTCEENIQYQADEEVSPAGTLLESRSQWFGARPVRVNGVVDDTIKTPMSLNGMGYAASKPLDGRQYGWVCEIDPGTGSMEKHTALGRFRHENVALRVEVGKPLAAYMGDDRRGGHVWKFVSTGTVQDPADPANAALLREGTLHVARLGADFTGRWIPLTPETPLRRPEPEQCPTHHMIVPARFVGGYVAIGDTDRDNPALEVDRWQKIIADYAGKPFEGATLGDLVRPEPESPEATAAEDRLRRQGVILMDAFAMANACGGTPTARPEDIEVHPADGSVYIAFTDATDSSDGSPDARIFPDSRLENSRQYGAIFRLVEDGDDPAAATFTWGKFIASGEVADNGGGFANADNLAFDPQGNLWMVTDITNTAQNFPTTRQGVDGTRAGGKQFPGVFGNNAMFMIPTEGPHAGIPHLFALGPMECELCGPTFSDDGTALILSVQHPGEQSGTRTAKKASEEETFLIHDRQAQGFEQLRTLPVGSNFPAGELGKAPRPAVVCITRG